MNIVITGASRGIGKELVGILSESAEHRIVAVSRNLQAMKVFETHNVKVISVDITNDEDVTKLDEFIKKELGEIDVLINNAGLLIPKSFEDISRSDFHKMMNVNFEAPFFLIQKLLPHFSSGSHIVNISSMGAFQGSSKYPGLSVYSASKAALAILSECLALELAEKQIKVNALALGAAQTEMLEKAFPGYKAPLSANEMAEFIAHFAINGHKHFNGQIIPVTLSNP